MPREDEESLLHVLLRTRAPLDRRRRRRRKKNRKAGAASGAAKETAGQETPAPSLFLNPAPWEPLVPPREPLVPPREPLVPHREPLVPHRVVPPPRLDPYAAPFTPGGMRPHHPRGPLEALRPVPPRRCSSPPLHHRATRPWLDTEELEVIGRRHRQEPPPTEFEEKQITIEKFVEQYVSSSEELDHLTQLDDGSLSVLLEAADRLQEYQAEEKSSLGISAPLRYRVMCSLLPEETKHRILQQLGNKSGPILGGGGQQDAKYRQWVESALRLPLGCFSENPAGGGDDGDAVPRMLRAAEDLETSVYGHATTKQDLLQRMVNGSPPAPLLLCGPPGVGKTRIARKVLANAMGKPFVEIPMGGATNADFLRGSLYVYEGSGPGRLVQGLQSVRTMDPVVFLDEIDKVSSTPHGAELASVLIQLVDGTQNDGFEDKYFAGIKLDVSRIQFVFAANDLERIDPVLRDRLDVIQIGGYTREEKREILERHLVPEISEEVGLAGGGFRLADSAVEELLRRVDPEQGVRRLREMLRHTLQSVAAAKNVALSGQSEKACKVLGIDEKLHKMIADGLKGGGGAGVDIDDAIVNAVLDQRSHVVQFDPSSSSLYM